MKFYDTHFEDYIKSNKELSLHPKLSKQYDDIFPKSLKDFTITYLLFLKASQHL